MSWPDPKVVISEGIPPAINVDEAKASTQGVPLASEPLFHLRNRAEMAAAIQIVDVMRRDGEPIAIIYRKPDGSIHVDARGSAFPSVAYATKVFQEASARIVAALVRKRVPEQTS